ncbi:MAG: Wzz/FepE/Etk N-terminal domain-containing protein [Atopobiaceae bacterium]|nr:Wzz/FepE/Etk N-terminal domain-containing protein [Atopobiaceae bacterium]MCH4230253.1 Wzz/FepE/Etk N-terminal domain-containing protein [Atopobiaceae bacterium]MCI1260363.1 Wzz/FepE/Etk N-terminal domain-containing protein [Atopobiaceae bacterium]MDD2588051.1 Wzz/FepE/Etk N-terminal domain-containing protein [Atopobiaceae bacterium]MDD3485286.1 Wzz/FepE/Etk N-terminal domain-containing protein [Atopobiaceae bacterium]
MTLLELFHLLRKHLSFIVTLAVGAAVVVGIVSVFLPNQYTASTTVYVLSNSSSSSSSSNSTYTDLSASQMLSNDVVTIIKSSNVKKAVADSLGISNLSSYTLSVTSSTTTRVVSLSVTGPDAQVAADVANAYVSAASDVAKSAMGVEAINTIDAAQAPSSASGPNRLMYVLVGFVAGLLVAVAYVVLRDMLDTRARSGHEVEELLGVPVVGHFPLVDGR